MQILHLRAYSAVESAHLGVGCLDDDVFVPERGLRCYAQAEVARRQIQRFAGKHVAGPRSSEPRPENWIDSVPPVYGGLRLNQRRIPRRRHGIVTAAHVDFDIGEPMLCEMHFKQVVPSCIRRPKTLGTPTAGGTQ
jgi:hypothetical protein